MDRSSFRECFRVSYREVPACRVKNYKGLGLRVN